MIENPIYLCGVHKSGTSLLRSLLDGHPHLFVIPYETHIFQHSKFWVNYYLRRTRPPYRTFSETAKILIERAKRVNARTDKYSDTDIIGRLDINRFEARLYQDFQLIQSYAEFITQFYNAIYYSIYETDISDSQRIVEKTVENAEYASYYRNFFSGAKFIHVLRNPYSNLVTLRRVAFQRQKKYPFLFPFLKILENSYFYLYRNKILMEDNYHVVRYEDLIHDTKNTMKIVAGFIGVEFMDILLRPTILGKEWEGNSSLGIKFDGVSNMTVDVWKNEIKDQEIHLINYYFRYILESHNYEVLKPKTNFYLPMKGECAKYYLANRVIKHFNR